MRCPYCGYEESKVIDSRPTDEGERIRRRRECLKCTKRFTTYEMIESLPIVVIKKDKSRETFNREKLLNGLLEKIPYCRRNTPKENTLPGVANLSIRFVEGEAMLLMLDMRGICASSGSACTSGSLDPSHVMLAIGLDHGTAHGSIRFSLDKYNTEEEIDYILEVFPTIVERLREMSPIWTEENRAKIQ